ncbi:MAG: glutathione S-transferase N-terminal domain-containing protein [Pseudomonadota bacterium]|nr:glutathione S-transferase N-terminal domain-containing protein [Pseudomonadota bacterium]
MTTTFKNVIIYTTNVCPYCQQAKRLLTEREIPFEEISLEGNNELRTQLSQENNGWRTVPMIFADKKFIGGYDDLHALLKSQD